MRNIKVVPFLLILLGVSSLGVRAQNTDCLDPISLVADGRIINEFIGATTEFWYELRTKADASYVLEVHQFTVESGTPTVEVFQATGFNTSTCTGTTFPGRVIIDSTDPGDFASAGEGERIAWVGDGTNVRLKIENTSASSRSYLIMLAETTQYNPRWSTFGGFSTQWGFHNTTRNSISGTLKVTKTDGTVVATDTFSVSPGRVVFKTTSGLGIGPNQAGNAIFFHTGPQGGIQADAFLVSGDTTTVIPSKFEGTREAMH